MYECPKCGCAVIVPGLCTECSYKADGTGDTYLGRRFCTNCNGSGRIIGSFGYDEACPFCNGAGNVDTW
jgi:DnaJ-class molecular chaperone